LPETDDPDALDCHACFLPLRGSDGRGQHTQMLDTIGRAVPATSDAPTFWVGRHTSTESRLPYVLRLPVSGEGRLFARGIFASRAREGTAATWHD
jgi:hypothetical protein